MRFLIASFNFTVLPLSPFVFVEFHNNYMANWIFYLVEFHDIDKRRPFLYNIRGIPRNEERKMIVTFAGHSQIQDCEALAEKLMQALQKSVPQNEKVSFYCGGYGEFDALCARVCRAFRKSHPRCEVVLITPYITEAEQKKLKDLQEKHLYDAIVYPPLESVPLRYAISRRNEWMANEADLLICYISHTFGGAYKTVKFAQRKKKKIIHLAEE